MTKNLGTTERIIRFVLGGGVAIGALMLLLSERTLGWQIAYVALIALGADFIYTALTGYCPLYKSLGWNTAAANLHR